MIGIFVYLKPIIGYFDKQWTLKYVMNSHILIAFTAISPKLTHIWKYHVSTIPILMHAKIYLNSLQIIQFHSPQAFVGNLKQLFWKTSKYLF